MGLYIAISNSIGASSISGGAKKTFEFTINTANLSAGSTTDTQFKLPLTTSTGLDCKVSWGDGTSDTITSHLAPEVTHTYASVGTYTVKITGSLLGWSFNNGGDRLKMLNVSQWAGLNISVDRGFFGCTNLTASATDAPLITSTSLQIYFSGCSNFNGAIGNWDVSNVTSMSEMFFGATSFNQNIGAWNTSVATNIQQMFQNATAFNQNIGAWDVSKVTTFASMFINATAFNNGGSDDIDNWTLNTTSNIVMENMFRGCPFNQNIGSWNTQRVTSLRLMFFGNFSFNQNIGSWNTSNVINMSSMFNGASAFNQNIGAWDVSKVTTFASMFINATAFNNGGSDDIDNWTFSTTSNIDMSAMFGGSATAFSCKFNRYIGSWNTERVTNMSSMFANNTAFNQNIGAWNTSAVTNMGAMFFANGFNQPIGSWNTSAVTNMDSMFTFNTAFNQDISSWNTSAVTNMFGMFQSATAFNQPIGTWDTSAVTNMASMFQGASVFNQNIGAWNVSNVTTFASMFYNATAFNNGGSDDIDNWTFSTTSNINMRLLFCGDNTTISCKFNRYIGSWNTQRVVNMEGMFVRNTAFNQDIGAWDVSNVTIFSGMFGAASAFNQNIGSWDVSKATFMQDMFNNATSFNQDIGGWNVSNVTLIINFMSSKTAANYSATNLDSIYNGWSSRPVKPNISINFGTIKYTAAGQAGKDILTNAPNLWTCVDGGI